MAAKPGPPEVDIFWQPIAPGEVSKWPASSADVRLLKDWCSECRPRLPSSPPLEAASSELPNSPDVMESFDQPWDRFYGFYQYLLAVARDEAWVGPASARAREQPQLAATVASVHPPAEEDIATPAPEHDPEVNATPHVEPSVEKELLSIAAEVDAQEARRARIAAILASRRKTIKE